ncbi:MAG: type III pantothenate kinase [Deltaproteobacteria bacterium]|nr:type III pantothenate kinase [Deltaproteobacteria bacterium]
MLLAIDIGNSHTVIGLFRDGSLAHNWRIQTNRKNTADEIAATLHGLFSQQGLHFTGIGGMIIANVVPPLEDSWLAFARTITITPLMVNERLQTGMPILTDNPAEVGADRIVNAVAGFQKYAAPLIIVDFGTATTFDCVSGLGEYMGGAIAPGLAISLDALGRCAARLPRIHAAPPQNAIGKNTISALQSGVLFGYGGLVEGLVSHLSAEFPAPQPLVIATGGMAQIVAPYAPAIKKIEPQLTLEGLKLIYERCH